MPKITHEALVELVRRAPELVLSLLWPEGSPLRTAAVHVTSGEVVDFNTGERKADVVLVLDGAAGRPEGVFVVEAQTQIDGEKLNSWPVYITGLRSRHRCPTALVVFALDRRVAAWCAAPIDLGWGRGIIRPWVIGPDDIPIITDPERARAAPELAVLSVAAHADEPVGLEVALTALDATRDLDGGRHLLYTDFIFGLLGAHARTLLEQLMSTSQRRYYSEIFQEHFDKGLSEGEAKGKAEGIAEGEAKGKAEGIAEGEARGIAKGKAQLLLRQLALKGFTVAETDRQRILTSTDPDLLDTWAGRVLTATSLSDVLDPA